jgi:hypothetical protein
MSLKKAPKKPVSGDRETVTVAELRKRLKSAGFKLKTESLSFGISAPYFTVEPMTTSSKKDTPSKKATPCIGFGRNGWFKQVGTQVWSNTVSGNLDVNARTSRNTDGGCRMELTPKMARELINQLRKALKELKD